MNRLEANRKLLDFLREKIEKNPQLRFIQALWGCKLIDSYETESGNYEIVDRFNEESTDTLNRIQKGTPEGESTKMNSFVPCNNSSVEELFICQCNDVEHQLIFSYFPDERGGDVYTSVHLSPDSWWKRIINGFKYIFGHRSRYGDFDEFLFKPEDADRLQNVVNYLKSCAQ